MLSHLTPLRTFACFLLPASPQHVVVTPHNTPSPQRQLIMQRLILAPPIPFISSSLGQVPGQLCALACYFRADEVHPQSDGVPHPRAGAQRGQHNGSGPGSQVIPHTMGGVAPHAMGGVYSTTHRGWSSTGGSLI